jgi:UDP-N-acetylmuramate dehydrogenase
MTVIKEHVNLKTFHTFGIEVYCKFFTEINSISEFIELLQHNIYESQPRLIIGGGSNLLFTKDFEGLVIRNNLKGLEIILESGGDVLIKAGAGEVWHELVMWSIGKGFAGLENLSLIPGCVGASPMQNIGAYGVEIREVFESLEAYDLNTGQKRIFFAPECEFGYRESVFKNKYKNKFLIASVTFRLKKNGALNTSYGAINDELRAMHVENPTIKDVSNAVINIRTSKLPDPKKTGNAGSFFKNPEVSSSKYHALKGEFPQLVAYPLSNGNYKLAAGWLIEQCGLKGYEQDGAAVHSQQALVLVNKNHSTGENIYRLSSYVLEKVAQKFDVALEREVNII